ncbi:GyrI-like domain-containing protein [Hymenobacter sp. BT175]|uniref:GyrI-like domain-containing protein n=1 Tax=Hymenobacter translucens TaxID=2886507 RepID=UPI001D0E3CDA|nr:GyrI-like domain-containing protein [Hymenobacter translucens]MCC2545800.1 GyrI-like domain-containing protein [Hymenobacter translucens]
MNRWILLFVLLLAIGGTAGYAYLGGFQAPQVQVLRTPRPDILAGYAYQGSAQSDEFGQLFRRAKELQDSGKLRGDLANIYYNNPERAEDTVHAFVGLAVADTLAPLPAGCQYRILPAGRRVVQVSLKKVSYLLAPNKLYPAAKKAVEQQKLKARNVYFERFTTGDDSELRVDVE